MTAEMTIMSCRCLVSGADRCAATLRYVSNLFRTAEMYARNGFIACPIVLLANLQAENAPR